jgi:hypothetical protein
MDEITGKARGRKTGGQEIWVAKGFDGPLIEAFRFFDTKGLLSTEGWRKYSNFQYALKSTLLAVDAFHGQVLMAVSMMANPVRAAQVLAIPGEAFKTGLPGARIAALGGVSRTAGGAVAGAGAAAALGGEGEEVAVGGLVGALWSNALVAAMRNSLLSRKASMTPGLEPALAYMGLAGWTGRPADRAIGAFGRLLGKKAEDLRRSGGNKLLISAIEGTRHLQEGFNQVLWETIHNGGKQFYFTTRWLEAHGKSAGKNIVNGIDMDLLQASREIMQSANNAFGGQQMSRLWRNPQFQQYLTGFQLSPDWTSSRLLGAGSVLMNMSPLPRAALGAAAGAAFEAAEAGFDMDHMTARGATGGAVLGSILGRWGNQVAARIGTKGDVMAREARRLYGAALLGGYVVGNLLNRAFTGRWMFQNEEGSRMHIELPDGTRIGFGKAYKEAFEFAGADPKYSPLSRLASKGSPLARAAAELWSNQTWNGPIYQLDAPLWEQAGSLVKYASGSVTPIALQGPVRAVEAVSSGRITGPAALTLGVVRASGIQALPPLQGLEGTGIGSLVAPTLGRAGLSSLLTDQRNLR